MTKPLIKSATSALFLFICNWSIITYFCEPSGIVFTPISLSVFFITILFLLSFISNFTKVVINLIANHGFPHGYLLFTSYSLIAAFLAAYGIISIFSTPFSGEVGGLSLFFKCWPFWCAVIFFCLGFTNVYRDIKNLRSKILYSSLILSTTLTILLRPSSDSIIKIHPISLMFWIMTIALLLFFTVLSERESVFRKIV